MTTPYDAENGQTRGGVIDMDLKSGTNKIHGDLYEYARRTWLDANWWVNDSQKVLNPTKKSLHATPQHKLDQYGFELDGPVVIPKVFNGRNKLSFVTQFENWNEIEPAYADTSVPFPQWANGDFSGLTYDGQPDTIYNSYDTYSCVDQNGNFHTCRHPFPNNQIPPGMPNPTAQAILKYYPKPNQPGASGTPWQNFYTQEPTVDKYRNALIKLDWVPTAKDRFSLRYGYWERYETDVSNGILTGPGGYGEDPLGDRAHTFAAQWTHTVTPNLLFDFKADVDIKAEIAGVAPTGFDSTTIGWPSSLTSQLGAFSMLPGFSPSGFTGVGDKGAGNGLTTTYGLNMFPSVTWVKGKHTIHAGIDWRMGQYAIVLNASTQANFSFNQVWTQNCWSCGDGNDYAGNDLIAALWTRSAHRSTDTR